MIGFIGGGNMAEALIKGMTSRGMGDIMVSEPRGDRRGFLEQSYKVKTTGANRDVALGCAIVILAVKPQNMEAVLDEITDAVTDEKTVVSIAAGITLSYLQSRLKTRRLVRVMPNTPALVQKGMSVISFWDSLNESDMDPVREIFMSVGKVVTLPEKHMDAVTALSGSGPAFVAFFAEAIIEAGVAMGLDSDHASELALQTLIGTAHMLEAGMPPRQLREMVTSPGGTTAAGLRSFDEQGLKKMTLVALQAAQKKAEELGRRS